QHTVPTGGGLPHGSGRQPVDVVTLPALASHSAAVRSSHSVSPSSRSPRQQPIALSGRSSGISVSRSSSPVSPSRTSTSAPCGPKPSIVLRRLGDVLNRATPLPADPVTSDPTLTPFTTTSKDFSGGRWRARTLNRPLDPVFNTSF